MLKISPAKFFMTTANQTKKKKEGVNKRHEAKPPSENLSLYGMKNFVVLKLEKQNIYIIFENLIVQLIISGQYYFSYVPSPCPFLI